MIIVPFIIFFIYVLYANGIWQEATLIAANVNYSDGIGLVRSQADAEVDMNSSNYVLMKNNSTALQTESSSEIGLGVSDSSYARGWGGRLLTNKVDPNVSGFSVLYPDDSKFSVAYPVSPFVSLFQR